VATKAAPTSTTKSTTKTTAATASTSAAPAQSAATKGDAENQPGSFDACLTAKSKSEYEMCMMRAFDSFLDHFLKVELPKLEVCAAGASVAVLPYRGNDMHWSAVIAMSVP
jgi:hypothetical protein